MVHIQLVTLWSDSSLVSFFTLGSLCLVRKVSLSGIVSLWVTTI